MLTLYDLLKKEIEKRNKIRMSLNDIYDIIEKKDSEKYWLITRPEGYLELCRSIDKLIEENIIKPSGKKVKGLYQKYSKVKEKQDFKDTKLKIANLPGTVSIKHYMNHPEDFLEDEEYINVIISFLNNPNTKEVSLNERSYELFGDEKFLKNPGSKTIARGEVILNRLDLNSEDLFCYPSYEPFIHFIGPKFFNNQKKNILIVENLDTFWSFKKLIFESNSSLDVDMLIFGKGNGITGNLGYLKEYGIGPEANIGYFGDIDAAGINIYYSLVNKFTDYNIKPLISAYKHLVDTIDSEHIKTSKKKHRINEDNIEQFIQNFESPYKEKITKILISGSYIPQEAISFASLESLFVKEGV